MTAGGNPFVHARRPRLIDPYLEKVEELVERSRGKVRADVVHRRIAAMGFGGDERTTRRAVAEIKDAWQTGHRRRYRPWVPEPGMWSSSTGATGRASRAARRSCSAPGWRGRAPGGHPHVGSHDGDAGGVPGRALRRLGGAPTYLLSDNEKTVTVERVAGIPVRHPTMVAVGRHYGCKVESCVPYDPESKGGVEATVKIAKRDLVPTAVNLRDAYSSSPNWSPPATPSGHRQRPPASRDRPGTRRDAHRGAGLAACAAGRRAHRQAR